MKKLLLASIAIISFTANAADTNKLLSISVSEGTSSKYRGFYQMSVVIKEDMTINSLIVNRDKERKNCSTYMPYYPGSAALQEKLFLDSKVSFGEKYNFYTECNPIEISVKTSKGEFTISWDR